MRRIILSLLATGTLLAAVAGPIDDARSLYDEGRYDEALTALETLKRKSPRDGNVNLLLGATYMALGREHDAVAAYKVASDRGLTDATLALARIATDNYDIDDARTYYSTYEKQMRRARKEIADDVEADRSRLVAMENMLERVEQIEVIDSLTVDADEFFKAYRLSPEAGRLIDGATIRMPGVGMAFLPQNNTELIYSTTDADGRSMLMCADILDDGTYDHPDLLPGEDLTGGGNADYPFLLSDGVTLYFANDGEESIGGYDIFMTRRNDSGYLQPQNIGMPYNSPADDYLLAIDETTGAGWWATDRNHIPGKVTIYIFVPSTTRVNISPDDENLAALARLTDISMTQVPDKDYASILDAIANVSDDASSATRTDKNSFYLPIASTTVVYESLSDFKNPQARSIMGQAINARAEINSLESRLADLREKYRKGDKSVGVTILNLEQQLDDARLRLQNLINNAIATETGQL